MRKSEQAWVGVDVGSVRVGVAVAEDGTFAVPHATMPADDAPAGIVALLESLGVTNVVVGWPLELSGREGFAVRRVQLFIDRLEKEAAGRELVLNLKLRDERLTTGLADRLLDDAGVRGKKRKGVVDQVAATQILQAFLDELRFHGPQEEED